MLNNSELERLVDDWTRTALDFLAQTGNFGQMAANMTRLICDDPAICKADLDMAYHITEERERSVFEQTHGVDSKSTALSAIAVAICDAYRNVPAARQ